MKQLIKNSLFLVLLALPFLLEAQESKAYELNINGVKVIVQPAGGEIISIQTGIRGGVANYPPAKAGIEALAVRALTECGTKNDDKNSFKNKLDKVSAQITGSTSMDYSSIYMNCIKSDFETVWPLYADAILNPAFDTKEFDRIKQDAITSIRSSNSDPDNAIIKLGMETAFNGRNYATDPQGTEASVSGITASAAKQYWKSILTRSRMVIVIVGDLDKAVIEKKVKALLAPIPQGKPFVFNKQSYTPASNTFKAEERENATNYVLGITSGPVPGAPDFNAFVLAMRVFYNKHFLEVRTNNGLSYAPQTWFSQGAVSYSNVYVSTTNPDKYIAVARQLIDRVKQEGFTAEELKNMKTQYLTNVYTRDETNDALSGSFLFNQIIHNDWKRTLTIKNDISKVTLDQMNTAFRKYINNITWVYQGDPKKVNPVLYTQKQTPAIPEEKKGF